MKCEERGQVDTVRDRGTQDIHHFGGRDAVVLMWSGS